MSYREERPLYLPILGETTCNLLLTPNPTFATCRASTSDTTKQGQPTLRPNIGCDSKPRCSKAYVSFSSDQNPLNTPKKGRQGQRLPPRGSPFLLGSPLQPATSPNTFKSFERRLAGVCAPVWTGGRAGFLHFHPLHLTSSPVIQAQRSPTCTSLLLTASLASCSAIRGTRL